LLLQVRVGINGRVHPKTGVRVRNTWYKNFLSNIPDKFVMVMVKFTLEQATKAQKGSRGIALLYNLGARWRGFNATLRPFYRRYPSHIISEIK